MHRYRKPSVNNFKIVGMLPYMQIIWMSLLKETQSIIGYMDILTNIGNLSGYMIQSWLLIPAGT